ncbi:MAG: hypothetical protein HY904_18000 [Deltaproteobacteria bacterium]|nr:hypothetical protein [Deltaproteobacteria bacterium]
MSMFWELHQQRSIHDARNAAASAENKSEQVKEYIQFLEARVDKMQLACQAMWELMRETAHLDDDRLMAKIQEIDLRDGTLDGKIATAGNRCDACQRTVNPRHARCLYCGAELVRRHAFRL